MGSQKERVLGIVKRKKRKYVKKSEIGKDSKDIRELFKKQENRTNIEKDELKERKEKLENLPKFDVIFNVQEIHQQQHPAKSPQSSQPIAGHTPKAPKTRGGPKIMIPKTDKRKRERPLSLASWNEYGRIAAEVNDFCKEVNNLYWQGDNSDLTQLKNY